jgi:molybdopterin-dependent oxidoreductase alpha subunit
VSSRNAGGWAALGRTAQELMRSGAPIRGAKALGRLNQVDGFDCPGCAWPEPEERSSFEFCENGAKAIAAETTSRLVGPDFFAKHTVTELLEKSDYWLEQQGRLAEPMVYDPDSDRYVAISWEEAFSQIGSTLSELDHPDRAIFYTSGRTSNEAAFLYQLFVRCYGTNNLPDCSNMCHESSGTAMMASVGVGKGTVTLEDFEHSDVILVIGQNPGTNHPRMLSTLQKARERGATIIAINPLREVGLERFIHPQRLGSMLSNRPSPISTHYLQPLIGGDLALITGVLKALLEAEEFSGDVLDRVFIDEHTTGFDLISERVQASDWQHIETESGIERAAIEQLAGIIAKANGVIACWAMGLTQQRHAVPTLQQLSNVLLARGMVGKKGAGLCPVRGHSNVQGDRTMGIYERPSDAFLDRLDEHFGITSPRHHGVDVVAAIERMHKGEADFFLGMGGNFAQATPDSDYTAEALKRCAMTVQVSTKLNRSHLIHGKAALILPCLGRSEIDEQASGEQAVTVEDSMSMVHASHGRLRPASPALRSEPAIVAGIAQATLGAKPVDWAEQVADYAAIRRHIAAVIPGFEGFEERLATPGGFHLDGGARERQWATPSGKARFIPHDVPSLGLPEGQIRLMTMRSHDQYNTTVYGLNDRYRGIRGERMVVFCNADDLTERGLSEGDQLRLVSIAADGERSVDGFRAVPYDLPRGCAAAYFPEANPLVPIGHIAKGSRTPISKFIPIRLEAMARM